jgi:hypothetical protein
VVLDRAAARGEGHVRPRLRAIHDRDRFDRRAAGGGTSPRSRHLGFAYDLVGAAPAGSDLIYFAFGNYTTLGYGDIAPVYGWPLLAPMTALNGIMLIGWSTALVIEVLRRTGHAPSRKLAQTPVDQ